MIPFHVCAQGNWHCLHGRQDRNAAHMFQVLALSRFSSVALAIWFTHTTEELGHAARVALCESGLLFRPRSMPVSNHLRSRSG